MMNDFETRRREMIRLQMAERGLNDPVVLEAINSVSREKFVPKNLIDSAYWDTPLPIGGKSDHFSALYCCFDDGSPGVKTN